MATSKPFRILALAGGGYLGLYTATVLSALEARYGVPLGKRFDLIAGTSVGGILAVALAYEVPMPKLVDLFVEHGSEVFSRRGLPNGTVGRMLDMSRSILGPKYSGDSLRALLARELGTRTLAEARHDVVVPAVNVTRSLTKVFKTPHVAASRGDETVRAVDVAMATSAAPAYFPSVPIGGELYADGGLFAVAPDQVALHEAEHFMRVDLERISMLSIGTATVGYRPSGGVGTADGAVDWLADGRLLLTLVSVQQQHVQAMMEDRLGRRYRRIDAAWPTDAALGIDVATPKAAQALEALARQTVAELDLRSLDNFLGVAG